LPQRAPPGICFWWSDGAPQGSRSRTDLGSRMTRRFERAGTGLPGAASPFVTLEALCDPGALIDDRGLAFETRVVGATAMNGCGRPYSRPRPSIGRALRTLVRPARRRRSGWGRSRPVGGLQLRLSFLRSVGGGVRSASARASLAIADPPGSELRPTTVGGRLPPWRGCERGRASGPIRSLASWAQVGWRRLPGRIPGWGATSREGPRRQPGPERRRQFAIRAGSARGQRHSTIPT